MAITKDEALQANVFVEDRTNRKWRRNGATKTWKSPNRQHEFRVPVKFGLYGYGYITNDNASRFSVLTEGN